MVFIPNLDNGLPFEELGNHQGSNNRIGYEIPFQLSTRSDVLLITVTFADGQTTYDSAGFITQYWVKNGVRHQTMHERVWVNTKTIVPIEPLESSLIVFRPVDWLRNWSLNLQTRPYQEGVVEEDIADLQQSISINFSDLRSTVAESFALTEAQNRSISDRLVTVQEAIADLLARESNNADG